MTVANTSKTVYHTEIKGDKENSENKRVLECLKSFGRPATGREISKKTGIENSAVARCLNNLKSSGRVYVQFEAKCRLTNRMAQHYLPVGLEGKQVNLF